MRALRPLLVLSLPVALAPSACTGAGTPTPSTVIDVGTAASSQSPGPSWSSTPASTAAPSTTASGASQPKLAWGDGKTATWGEPVKPDESTPSVKGTVKRAVSGSLAGPRAFVGGELLSSQEPSGSFDGGTGTFKDIPALALGERVLATSKGIDGAKPGQILAAAANKEWAVWVVSPSSQAGPSPWTIYRAKLDGSEVSEVFGSDDVGDESFASTRLVLTQDSVAFTIGMVPDRHVVTSTLDGTQQSLIPAPGASDVWAAGGDNTVMWSTHEDGQIRIVKAATGGDFPLSTSVVLSVPAEASGEELAPLRLLAGSGDYALIATGDKVATVDLKAKTVREVTGLKARSMAASGAAAGSGRLAVQVDGGDEPSTRVLSIAPSGAVQLVTLPATEGGLAVDADRIAVTNLDKQLTVVRVS